MKVCTVQHLTYKKLQIIQNPKHHCKVVGQLAFITSKNLIARGVQ